MQGFKREELDDGLVLVKEEFFCTIQDKSCSLFRAVSHER